MWSPDMRATYSRGGIIRLRTCWPARTISIPPILLRVNGKRVFVPAVVSIDDTQFAASRFAPETSGTRLELVGSRLEHPDSGQMVRPTGSQSDEVDDLPRFDWARCAFHHEGLACFGLHAILD
jgi:hypothetical protein